MPRGRTASTVAGVVVAVLAATASVVMFVPPDTDLEATSRPVDFSRPEPLWAEETTLHYGDKTFDLGASYVRGMSPSPHGIFLEVARKRGYDVIPRWVLFDGKRTHELPGEPDDVKVSADGRYAGWLDREGPRRPIGRLAVIVVVELETGDTVFRTSEGMGDFTDDLGDLYEELDPRFLGFDAENRAYWSDASGSGGRRRADLGTGVIEAAERSAPAGAEASTVAVGALVDPRRGTRVSVRDGKEQPEQDAAETGWLSPDGRWLLGTEGNGITPRVTRPDTGEEIDLDTPGRGLYAGSWLGPDALSFLVTKRRLEGFDVSLTGGPSGTLVSCTLPAGSCTVVAKVENALPVVLPGGSIPDDGTF